MEVLKRWIRRAQAGRSSHRSTHLGKIHSCLFARESQIAPHGPETWYACSQGYFAREKQVCLGVRFFFVRVAALESEQCQKMARIHQSDRAVRTRAFSGLLFLKRSCPVAMKLGRHVAEDILRSGTKFQSIL
jgi:hypothetical protein